MQLVTISRVLHVRASLLSERPSARTFSPALSSSASVIFLPVCPVAPVTVILSSSAFWFRRLATRFHTSHAAAAQVMPFGLLLFCEGVEVSVGPDEQDIVRNRRGGRGTLAELRIRGHHFWFVGSGFQDSHRAVIEGGEIDIPVGGDRRGIIFA